MPWKSATSGEKSYYGNVRGAASLAAWSGWCGRAEAVCFNAFANTSARRCGYTFSIPASARNWPPQVGSYDILYPQKATHVAVLQEELQVPVVNPLFCLKRSRSFFRKLEPPFLNAPATLIPNSVNEDGILTANPKATRAPKTTAAPAPHFHPSLNTGALAKSLAT